MSSHRFDVIQPFFKIHLSSVPSYKHVTTELLQH